jgi:hypothetical protein
MTNIHRHFDERDDDFTVYICKMEKATTICQILNTLTLCFMLQDYPSKVDDLVLQARGEGGDIIIILRRNVSCPIIEGPLAE